MPPSDARQSSASKSSASKSSAGKSQAPSDSSSSEAVLQECEALEAELAILRNLYEQYFLGNERHPPTRAHDDFKKRVMRLKTGFIRSTAAKFRVGSIHGKYLTYDRLWARTLQEIEAGTYKRDLFKARRRAEVRGPSSSSDAKKGVVELPEDISDMDFEEVEEILRPRPANEPQVPSAAASVGTPFRGTPSVPSVTPAVAPVSTPPPSRGSVPGVAPLTAGGMPSVAPVTGTPPRGQPTVAPVTGTPPRGQPTVAPVTGAPMRGGLPTVTSPLGSAPAKAPATVPPGMAAKPAGTVSTVPPARTGVPGATTVPRPATVPPPSSVSKPPPSAGGGGMSDDKLRAVYDAYVTAKRRCQEDTSKISYESVAATLRKQVPELLKQHNAKAVEFKVVIKDGKASLKAVPK
ncbi:MXAN_5187 C-terminal domain-containing protein [Myxococcus eversor]|uniref:MXAN_5187 C-terminal domain-containing protein n=1 Tax=Myxococcus eversor TaxID=2709661 RepID=UPI0013D03069|nr:MXAN_5187 C-terminal domain-containing protein [Myxococcus eversor]